MAEILSAAPGLAGVGAGGTLLLLVAYLFKSNRDDRSQHREIVDALREQHREESGDLEAKIDRLETRIDELQNVIDSERALRRDAQDQAARAEARASAAEAQYLALRHMMGADDAPATTRLPPPARELDPGVPRTGWAARHRLQPPNDR